MADLFRIRGGDFREYGPATPTQVLGWIRDGRADAATPAREADSSVWRRLSDYPEFVQALPAAPPEGRPVPGGPSPASLPSADELLSRPTSFHVLDSFIKGWLLLTRQPGPLLGAGGLVNAILLVLFPATFIPYAFLVTVPLALILAGPLAGGLSRLGVRAWRGHRVRVREFLDGFRSAFPPLLGTAVVLGLLTLVALCAGVGVVAMGVSVGEQARDLTAPAATLIVAGAMLTPLLTLLPFAFGGFAPALIMDRGIRPWEALRLSRQITLRHPVRSLLLAAGSAILLLVGLLLGGVGLFFTLPWVIATRACAYEELFGPRHAPPG